MVGEREGEAEEKLYSFSSYMVSTTPRFLQAFIAILAPLPWHTHREKYSIFFFFGKHREKYSKILFWNVVVITTRVL